MAPDEDVPTGLPLAGIRVADFSRVLAGPLATMLLGDLGADVVKVERPGTGDDTRGWGPPFVGDDAAYFLALNRNKRSVALDLGTEDGRTAARRLALASDVVVENFRPGLMDRFGLDHASLSAEHPGLVYCSLTAFGEDDVAGPTGLRHHRAGPLGPDELHRSPGWRTHEGRGRAARRDLRPVREQRDPGGAARPDRDRTRFARDRVAVRRERRGARQPGRQLPPRRARAATARQRASEHRPVPAVRDRRPPVHPGRGERPAVRADLRRDRAARARERRTVRDQRGPGAPSRRADPDPVGGARAPTRGRVARGVRGRVGPLARRSERSTRSSPPPRGRPRSRRSTTPSGVASGWSPTRSASMAASRRFGCRRPGSANTRTRCAPSSNGEGARTPAV